MAPTVLRQTTEDAVLKTRTTFAKGLEGVYELALFHADHARRLSSATKYRRKKRREGPWTSQRRLIDYGFHPYTQLRFR